jgi:hypothetical protein
MHGRSCAGFSDACMTTPATRTTSRRRRSAKARNRGRSGAQRCGHDYGELVVSTVAKRGVRRLCEGRYAVGVSARRGNSAVKRGEIAAAVRCAADFLLVQKIRQQSVLLRSWVIRRLTHENVIAVRILTRIAPVLGDELSAHGFEEIVCPCTPQPGRHAPRTRPPHVTRDFVGVSSTPSLQTRFPPRYGWDTLCVNPRDRTRRLIVPLSAKPLKLLGSAIPHVHRYQ